MSQETTTAVIQELTQSHRPEDRDLAKDILAYIDERSPDFKPIPSSEKYIAWGLANIVCNTLGQDDVSLAVAEYVCLCIKHGASPEARLVTRVIQANEKPAAGHLVVNAARRVGLSDLDFAKYWMISCGHYLKFGWTEERPQETRSGWGADVRIFYEKPPANTDNWSAVESLIWNLSDNDTVALLQSSRTAPRSKYGNTKSWYAARYEAALAKFKPEIFQQYLTSIQNSEHADHSVSWRYVLRATDAFDGECLRYCQLCREEERLYALIVLDTLRNGKYNEQAHAACLEKENSIRAAAHAYLADNFKEDLAKSLSNALDTGKLSQKLHPAFIMIESFRACAEVWGQGGESTFKSLIEKPTTLKQRYNGWQIYVQAITGLFQANPKPAEDVIRQWYLDLLDMLKKEKAKAETTAPIWEVISQKSGLLFEPELWQLLQDKSKTLRVIAVEALKKVEPGKAVQGAAKLLSAKKMDARMGAAMLLGEIKDDRAIQELKSGLATEESDKVRSVIFDSLAQQGISSVDEITSEPAARSATDLEEIAERQAKKIKLPKGNWLRLSDLPPLKTNDDETLSELAVSYLIQKQAKHKTINAAGDIQPFLSLFDRKVSSPFALALYQQWLDSEQSASDRWVLALTGLLSDTRAIPELTKPIKSWAENARHKLAEYAAQAVSLIPGDEALMVLDSLANRYRSKFKNIGKACREALVAAASERGVSTDELGDMIVPTFDFDEVGQRKFSWGDVSYLAQLGPNFKLTWIEEESEKEQKSLPSSMPADIKEDVKALNKLIRETVKGQTQRLELNLVRQRRWETKRWSELFEMHPLLQSFAANLVWGAYDSSGALQRTFRRYPNGLLANASGELIELGAGDATVGMIHPLELDAPMLDAWKEHLGRFKVKPPFPQLERRTVILEANHGNRKEISFTKDKEVSYGTFRSRTERLGWNRGSVVDAGGVSSYWKDFPGAGVEVFLHLQECWVGMDPMDTVTLENAMFSKADSIKRGSYEYDEPYKTDDPRVLSFGQVPAVVYSEAISDLKTIIGE